MFLVQVCEAWGIWRSLNIEISQKNAKNKRTPMLISGSEVFEMLFSYDPRCVPPIIILRSSDESVPNRDSIYRYGLLLLVYLLSITVLTVQSRSWHWDPFLPVAMGSCDTTVRCNNRLTFLSVRFIAPDGRTSFFPWPPYSYQKLHWHPSGSGMQTILVVIVVVAVILNST